MNEVSLFSGAGGGLLGTKLLGFTTIAYVEKDDYCQQVIAQRIKDGIYDEAPIFNDIDTFNDIAKYFAGSCEVVTAGFPCQPFSITGHQKGESDPRNKWPATIRAICRIQPKFVLLENVSGLISHKSGYFGKILHDLAEAGYDARWCMLGGDDCGAPQKRQRLWILAYNEEYGTEMADTEAHGVQGLWDAGNPVTDPHGETPIPMRRSQTPWPVEPHQSGEVWTPVVFSSTCDGDTCRACGRDYSECPCIGPTEDDVRYIERRGIMWAKRQVEPCMDRVVDGVADRNGRLKALGNGQIPRVVATAWRLLTGETHG